MQCVGIGGANGHIPFPRHRGRIARKLTGRHETGDAGIKAAPLQVARRHEAIAAVIAGAAQNADAGIGQDHLCSLVRDRLAGVFHQR